jgi:hypothetical protein
MPIGSTSEIVHKNFVVFQNWLRFRKRKNVLCNINKSMQNPTNGNDVWIVLNQIVQNFTIVFGK